MKKSTLLRIGGLTLAFLIPASFGGCEANCTADETGVRGNVDAPQAEEAAEEFEEGVDESVEETGAAIEEMGEEIEEGGR